MQLTKRFDNALVYASDLHRSQVRKGVNTPYLAHLLGVCSLVIENGGTEDEAIAALLHDAIEDYPHNGKTALEIQELFGLPVLEIVQGCSDSDTIPKPPWKERKEAYIQHIKSASASVRLVSSADKLYNARSILTDYRQVEEKLWSRFTGAKMALSGTIKLWYKHFKQLAVVL